MMSNIVERYYRHNDDEGRRYRISDLTGPGIRSVLHGVGTVLPTLDAIGSCPQIDHCPTGLFDRQDMPR